MQRKFYLTFNKAADLLPPFRGVTYQTLIGLLAATGMRLGEAIRLERQDVDWEHGVLTIRLSKFGKSRQIPVDPSTLSALRTYDQARDRLCSRPGATSNLFVSIRGTQLLGPNVDRTFHQVAGRAGLRPRSARCRPRLHDLATVSPSAPSSAGIAPAWMFRSCCRGFPHTSATPTLPTPTGISPRSRSCSLWPANVWNESGG